MKKRFIFLLVLILLCGTAAAEELVCFQGDGFSVSYPADWTVTGDRMPFTFDGDSGILVLTGNNLGMCYTAQDLLDYKIPAIIGNILAGTPSARYKNTGSLVTMGEYEMVETCFIQDGMEYYQYFCPVDTLVYQFTLTGRTELIEQILSSFTAK